jgi:rubrerythrin
LKNALDILQFAMDMEIQGQNFYISFSDKVENPVAKKMFESLAKEEKRHYDILKKEYDNIEVNKEWSEMNNLDEYKGESIFEVRKEAEKVSPEDLKTSTSDISILRMAYLIENDFAEFYKKAIENTEDPKGKKMLETLYEWENEHRKVFYEEYQKAMKDNWFDQSFSPF